MTLELYETSAVSTARRRKMHKQWEEEPWRIEHADDAKITFTTALHGKHTWEMPLEDSRRYHSSSHRWATDHPHAWEDAIAPVRRSEQYLASQAAYPVHEERIVTLKTGMKIMIRPARAGDDGALEALFHRLSPDNIYTRFFRSVRSLTYRELQTLCNVNHVTEVAFVAVTGPRENEEIVGHAGYWLSPTTNLAEVAFMVSPEWQGTGVGTKLQTRLVEYAISRGVRGFAAIILPRNVSMLRLIARAPGTVTTSRDEDAVHVTVLFPASAEVPEPSHQEEPQFASARQAPKDHRRSPPIQPRAMKHADCDGLIEGSLIS